MSRRLVVWRGLDDWRAEAAEVEFGGGGLRAAGTQIGAGYRVEYDLDATGDGFVTQRLRVVAVSDELGRRELDLDRAAMGAALDCDLALSPLTNAMPVLRHGLHRAAGAHDFTMAWVDVPSLEVFSAAQRYEHVRRGVVRYVDRGRFDGFTAEIEFDEEGLALLYHGLAVRASADLQ